MPSRFFHFVMMLSLIAVLPAQIALAEGFLSGANDIPLADGLAELPDGMLVFDKPEGRIVQLTTARRADLTESDIAAFYRRTLPNLGWVLKTESENMLTFIGQTEILRLTFSADLVMFDVTPNAAR